MRCGLQSICFSRIAANAAHTVASAEVPKAPGLPCPLSAKSRQVTQAKCSLGKVRPPLFLVVQDALDLLEVVEVMAGHHMQDALDGLRAALGVHAVVPPLFRLQRF
jgi:hypothetical protein